MPASTPTAIRALGSPISVSQIAKSRLPRISPGPHPGQSSVEILGHSIGGTTDRHYAHRAPLAFRAITTLPQPTAFQALVKGSGSECPCCRRRYADAG